MNITVFHFIGILITLILVAAVGIYSGSKVKMLLISQMAVENRAA